jgi:hypothetical protein
VFLLLNSNLGSFQQLIISLNENNAAGVDEKLSSGSKYSVKLCSEFNRKFVTEIKNLKFSNKNQKVTTFSVEEILLPD